MKGKNDRTLYQCFHSRVKKDRIRCDKGHILLKKSEDGGIDIIRLARGEPLAFRRCQGCPDFDCMGPPLPPEARGWVKKGETNDRLD